MDPLNKGRINLWSKLDGNQPTDEDCMLVVDETGKDPSGSYKSASLDKGPEPTAS